MPIELQDDFHLKLNSPLPEVAPGVRTLDQLKKVLMDPTAASDRTEMYYMYRKVEAAEDAAKMDPHNVRYDVTVIPPAKIGQELNKTAGHYHATEPGSKFAYPEVYEVIHGHALFLIQKLDEQGNLAHVYYLEAKAGDKVVYPPNYGHIIVNIGNEPIVTANWVADHFDSNYKDIEDRRGMAYYVTGSGDGRYTFIANPHYNNIPAIQELSTAGMAAFKIFHSGPMYASAIQHPDYLEFLTDPDKYAEKLSAIAS